MKISSRIQQGFPTTQARRLWLIAVATSLELLAACTAQPVSHITPPTAQPVAQRMASKPVEEVKLKTSDGWTIVGDLYQPSSKTQGAIVLLHQRNGTAADWQPLATALQQSGFTVLAIDQRGAGRSTQGSGQTGDNAPWQTEEDIAAAVASFPKLLPIGLAGASYGANNALIYAASHPKQVKALVLLSPGANYNGLDALAAGRSNHSALLIYHSRDDSIAGSGPQQINAISPSQNHKLVVLNGTAHGTGLLTPQVIRDVVKFFQSSFRSP